MAQPNARCAQRVDDHDKPAPVASRGQQCHENPRHALTSGACPSYMLVRRFPRLIENTGSEFSQNAAGRWRRASWAYKTCVFPRVWKSITCHPISDCICQTRNRGCMTANPSRKSCGFIDAIAGICLCVRQRLILNWYPHRVVEKVDSGSMLELGVGHAIPPESSETISKGTSIIRWLARISRKFRVRNPD